MNKTNLSLALVAMFAVNVAMAEEVKAINGAEKTYIKAAIKKSDGATALVPGTYWTGEKVIVAEGKCVHAKAELVSMKTLAEGTQAPEIKSQAVEVDCASRRAGSLTW